MSRKLVVAVAAAVLICLIAIGVTTADRPAPPAAPPRPAAIAAGEGANAKKEEAKVGKKEARIERAYGNKIDIKKLELDRQIAENSGELNRTLGASGLSAELLGHVGTLLGTSGSPAGSGGLGGRASTGQTVHLSNDDSMSLASAQRVLYALQNGVAVDPTDVRPHELLNYFTFHTAPPEPGEVFDVLASAEREGDQLHVALAVHAATPPRRPLDLTLLVDVSGSMGDDGKLDRAKRALLLSSQQLVSGDYVDLVTFDDDVSVVFSGWIGRGRSSLESAIAGLVPDGSTNLDLGLREAYRVARSHEASTSRDRRILVITDARLNTGDVDPDTVTQIARAWDEDGIQLTGVGVGHDFNDVVLDKLTEKGKGAYVFLGSDAVVERLFGPRGFASLTQTVAHDVRYALKLPPSLTMEQFYGEEASTSPSDVQPVNFAAGTSQVLLQDLQIRDDVPTDAVELEIHYRDPRTGDEQTRRFRSTVDRMVAGDPHNVRKALALMAWSDLLLHETTHGDCSGDLDTFRSRAEKVGDDREIAFLSGLVPTTCQVRSFTMHQPPPRRDLTTR
jgi:Ca-activated chloride channel family protein